MRWEEAEPYDWAVRFNEAVKAAILAHDHETLADFETLGRDAQLSIPTPEHYLPLLYVLGARGQDEPVRFFNDRIELASVSMLGVQVG
jgi:4,5-DOPA dioxygenase extradiol